MFCATLEGIKMKQSPVCLCAGLLTVWLVGCQSGSAATTSGGFDNDLYAIPVGTEHLPIGATIHAGEDLSYPLRVFPAGSSGYTAAISGSWDFSLGPNPDETSDQTDDFEALFPTYEYSYTYGQWIRYRDLPPGQTWQFTYGVFTFAGDQQVGDWLDYSGGVGGQVGYSFRDAFRVEFVVPEPSTFILLSTGALGLLAYAWRNRRRR